MPIRLVALDEGTDIPVDRAMMVVGRHPQCDARLDSIRVSRRHCCMTPNGVELLVRDLGSTNGIRINGQRVEEGRLRPGDELSIAHIRYRLDTGQGQEATLAEPMSDDQAADGHHLPFRARPGTAASAPLLGGDNNPLAAAVRDLLPSALADKCRIQVIVQMKSEAGQPGNGAAEEAEQGHEACKPDSSR
jgi:hypothetical protein